MRPAPVKLRSLLKTHGGKGRLARRIIALMPPHWAYLEPFGGGISVLLNKPRSTIEIAADVDSDIIGFWKVVKDRVLFSHLQDILLKTPYVESVFLACRSHRTSFPVMADSESQDRGRCGAVLLESARSVMVRSRFSRGGIGEDFAWSDRCRGGKPGDQNAWETSVRSIPEIHVRVAGVQFLRMGFRESIPYCDLPETLIYCDPPYLHETRTASKVYRHEMTEEDHVSLLRILLHCRGKVMLSGYRSSLYDGMLSGWTRHEWDVPNDSGQTKVKERRRECLWCNF